MSTCWLAGSSPGLRAEKGVIMKVVYFVGVALMLAIQAGAETYTWTDDNGTFNFTDDMSLVPQKYRKNVGKRNDVDVQAPASSLAVPDVKEKGTPAKKDTGSGLPSYVDNGGDIYEGKKAEVWQQQMRPLFAEVKRLEQELEQLESQLKNPVGMSREQYDKIPQLFKETQGRYKDALKKYNDLNDAANRAGLPAEFRK
jgi:hypothetical protein